MVALERAPEPGWEGQEESLGILHLASLAGVFSSTHLQGFGQAEFGIVTSPLRGDGMLEPEGSVAAGLGGRAGAYSLTHPPLTPRGLGEEEAPTLTGRWAWTPVGKAFPGPPGLKTAPLALA